VSSDPASPPSFRTRLHTVIFEADTPAGKAFDVLLLIAILGSIVVVCLESVAEVREQHRALLRTVEWGFTLLFTAEYVLRLYCIARPLRYARSFYGVVDLLAILPTWLSLVFAGTQPLIVIRALRLLRVFRVFKLGHFMKEADVLLRALAASRRKILVFVGAVVTLILILGTLMYMVEGEAGGFTSIPESVYWAIVTMTTVGYGDIAPTTVLGKFIASIAMITGYAIIAVPTGILGIELHKASRTPPTNTQSCPSCTLEGHVDEARYCLRCGAWLHAELPKPP
jgi:voltage-gated potassium channel